MGKLKSPLFTSSIDFDRWKKLMSSWIRTIPKNSSNNEIVAAIVVSCSNAQSREGTLDLILDLDEKELYPEPMPPLEGDAAREMAAPCDRKIPGLELIYKTLENKYGTKEEEKIFKYYEDFETLKRDPKSTMNDYIIKFESALRKLINSGIVFNDTILAYRLLKSASLGPDEKLVRTSVVKMSFEDMKTTLLKVSDGVVCTSDNKIGNQAYKPKVQIKAEPVEVLYQHEEDQASEDDEHTWNEHDDFTDNDYNSENEVFYSNRPASNWRGGKRGDFRKPRDNSYQRYDNHKTSDYSDRNFQRSNSQTRRYSYDHRRQPDERRQPSSSRQHGERISECHICKSIMHWSADCPHRRVEKKNLNKPEQILKVDSVIMDEEYLTYITNKDENLALIDSGATKTVCGEKWYRAFEDSLDIKDKNMIKEEKTECLFRFGDGDAVKSNTVKVIPTIICGQEVKIKANLVTSDIPLLISKNTLANAKANLNFEHGVLEMQGQQQKLIETPSGHFAVPIGPNVDNLYYNTTEHAVYVAEGSDKAKKIALKIHRYFAHASVDRLKKFVNSTNHELKSDICEALENLNCDLCKKHRRETPKPKTCLPLADRFNQTVALDLKFLENGEIILHCIDLLTRFSAAAIIPDKTQESIVSYFFKIWIALFGRPEQTLCDNGKEFCNNAFVDMCRNLLIDMKTTAAFAPFSNGIVERHNGLLAEMVYKIQEDVKCNTQIALSWAVSSKNNISNVFGFSPQQLVLGYNSPVPGLDNAQIRLSQLDGVTASKIVADNINAMHQARISFLEAQNSDRLKRALRDKVYQAYETKYYAGDKVYYRTNTTEWKGPGVVIGQYQKLVLVKTGGLFVRVHPSKLILQTQADKDLNTDKTTQDLENDQNISTDREQLYEESSSDSEEEETPQMPIRQEGTSDSPDTCTSRVDENVVLERQEGVSESPDTWTIVEEDNKKGRFLLDTGDQIRFKEKLDSSFKEAIVLGNAGRVSGINKNRYNIQTEDGSTSSLWADRVASLERKDHTTFLCIEDENTIMFNKIPNKEMAMKVEKAKREEIENFRKFEVYEEVPFRGGLEKEKTVSSRWIINEKKDGRVKARIVARGFEEPEGNLSTDAPTVDKTSIRTFLTIVAMNEWDAGSLDVKAAFLQSHELQRIVHMIPPKDIQKPNIIWKIKKPVYGLRDSAMNWYNTLSSDLKELGCEQSALDPTVFRYYEGNTLLGLFVCHVDDFLYSIGTKVFSDQVVSKLHKKYSISSQNLGSFAYVGLNLKPLKNGISIDQIDYTQSIRPVNMSEIKGNDEDLLDKPGKQLYQCLLGKVNWLAHQSRPDLSFYAYNFSLFSQNPTVENLKSLNKVMTKVMNGPNKLILSKLDPNSLQFMCFSDASFANVLPEKTNSGEGYLTFLCDNQGKCALLNWKSKKINRVVHSTISAEGLGLVDSIGDAVYIRNILEEILYKDSRAHRIPIHMYVDSKQLFKAISSNHMVTEKLLRINIAELKQMINDTSMNINLYWIPTKLMLSDCLTKLGASSEKLQRVMETGCIDIEELVMNRACLR